MINTQKYEDGLAAGMGFVSANELHKLNALLETATDMDPDYRRGLIAGKARMLDTQLEELQRPKQRSR